MDYSVVLVAESGSDISRELAEQYGIYIVPMHVSFGDLDKEDGSFDPAEIPSYFKRTGNVPKTSGASEYDIARVFDRVHAGHPQSHILYLAYSAVTTCSYTNAVNAAKGRSYIRLLDTKQASVGQCAVVIRIAKLIRQHPEWGIDRIMAEATIIIQHTKFFFLPTDLRFLQAGGRLSNAAAVFGVALKIIPCIEMKNGLLVAGKKYRGLLRKVVTKAIHDFTSCYHFEKKEVWLVETPGLGEDIKQIANETLIKNGFEIIHWLQSKGVITSHGGPNAFGMAAYELGI